MRTLFVAGCIMIVTGLMPALSQDKAAPANPALPGPEHKWLADEAGEWVIDASIYSLGASEPMKLKGTSTKKMLFERYLHEEFTIGEGNTALRGVGTIGFDNAAQQFKSVYLTNTGTGMTIAIGSRGENGDVLEFTEEHAGPAGKIIGRTVITHDGKDRRVTQYFIKAGDAPERKQFELVSSRKK